MTVRAQTGLGSFIAGLVLAGLFGILAGADAAHRGPYIGALATCAAAAIVGLIMFLTNRNN